MSSEFKIVGKNDKTVELIHKEWFSTRQNLNRLMLTRLMIITKNDDGASIKLKDPHLARFVNDKDIVERIKNGFPEEYVYSDDYEIEVLP